MHKYIRMELSIVLYAASHITAHDSAISRPICEVKNGQIWLVLAWKKRSLRSIKSLQKITANRRKKLARRPESSLLVLAERGRGVLARAFEVGGQLGSPDAAYCFAFFSCFFRAWLTSRSRPLFLSHAPGQLAAAGVCLCVAVGSYAVCVTQLDLDLT